MGSPNMVELLAELAALRSRTEAFERRQRELTALLEAQQAITSSLELEKSLQAIVRHAAVIEGEAGVWLLILDPERQVLTCRAATRFAPEEMATLTLAIGQGLSGLVALTRQPLAVSDMRQDPRAARPDFVTKDAQVSYLGIPMIYGDRLLGVLAFSSSQRHTYAPDEVALLTTVATQAAIAIENARLHEAAVRRGEELETLLRATRAVMGELDLQQILDRIVTEAAAITGCLHVKLLLVDHANVVLRVGALRGTTLPEGFQIPLGAGLSGKVAATGEPLFVVDPGGSPDNILAAMDAQTGVVTYLGLPIKSGDRVLGVLIFNTTDPHQYSAEELAYLVSFADYAAIAIEKAQLFQELNESYTYLQVVQDELIRAEKLRALGQMSVGIAHDLNNMLAAVLGQVELLGLQTKDPEIQETLRILEMATTDGAQVVRRLRDFARQRGRSPLTPIDLAVVVTEALEITRPRWRDDLQRHGRVIDIRLQLVGVPPILGYAPEVREVLTNLILNAVDAMPQGGTLSFTAREVGGGQSGDRAIGQSGTGNETDSRSTLPDRPVAELPSSPAAAWVELLVTDTGIGMSEDVRKRIFDPFFTTKGGRGTGMGLSIVYGIMGRHGGHVMVRSTRGQGATVALRFQKAQESLAAEEPMQWEP